MMKKGKRPSAYGMAGLVLAALLLIVWSYGVALQAAEANIYKTLDVLSDVITIIQRDYIEKISSEKLVEDSLKGMRASLDSYSHYIPPPEPMGTPVGVSVP